MECSFCTKERCDRFYVIPQEANADGNAALDFVMLCLCWCVQRQNTKQSERGLLPATVNFSSILPIKMTAFQVEIAELSIFQRSIPLMNHHARQ